MREFFRPRTDDQRFPSIDALEAGAHRRLPRFARDYMRGGVDREDGLARNRSDLDGVRFVPRYLGEPGEISTGVKVFGRDYPMPFAPGPVGLTGLMWPEAPLHIARAAVAAGVPVGLSTYATAGIEEMGAIAARDLWFQLYPLKDADIEADLLKRFAEVGGEVLYVTVDVTGPTRRWRDIGNGLSVPPRRDWRTYLQAALHPAWALATLRAGLPEFKNVIRYAPDGAKTLTALEFLGGIMAGHVTPERLARYREMWPGKLIVKGVLHVDDARIAADIGCDGIVVSNHGGRQLDAAPTAPEVLPTIRQAVGGKMTIFADGGVRTGLDIARMLAVGADFVLLGRAMTNAVGAMGPRGPAHALEILRQEFQGTLTQLGCPNPGELPRFLQPPLHR